MASTWVLKSVFCSSVLLIISVRICYEVITLSGARLKYFSIPLKNCVDLKSNMNSSYCSFYPCIPGNSVPIYNPNDLSNRASFYFGKIFFFQSPKNRQVFKRLSPQPQSIISQSKLRDLVLIKSTTSLP